MNNMNITFFIINECCGQIWMKVSGQACKRWWRVPFAMGSLDLHRLQSFCHFFLDYVFPPSEKNLPSFLSSYQRNHCKRRRLEVVYVLIFYIFQQSCLSLDCSKFVLIQWIKISQRRRRQRFCNSQTILQKLNYGANISSCNVMD